MEPLSLEEFECLIDSHPLIFNMGSKVVGPVVRDVGLTTEFYNFMHSHKGEFSKAVRDAVDELRGTEAMFGTAILHGIAHMIELYLGCQITEDYLPVIVGSVYMAQSPELWPGMKSDLATVIE